jgi:hypothetical protein
MVENYLEKATDKEQYEFLLNFADFIKSGQKLTEKNIKEIMEKS